MASPAEKIEAVVGMEVFCKLCGGLCAIEKLPFGVDLLYCDMSIVFACTERCSSGRQIYSSKFWQELSDREIARRDGEGSLPTSAG